jgi:uncharacterized membrane protein
MIVQMFFLLLAALCTLFLLVGLYKPWMMLWWEDVQNRRKVLRVYGTLSLVFYGIYFLFFLFY